MRIAQEPRCPSALASAWPVPSVSGLESRVTTVERSSHVGT